MKPIRRHKQFEKHFGQRITPNQKLLTQFEKRLTLFLADARGYPLNDHALTGRLAGKRAFSVANDIRVIYENTPEAYLFIDIGSHNQVY